MPKSPVLAQASLASASARPTAASRRRAAGGRKRAGPVLSGAQIISEMRKNRAGEGEGEYGWTQALSSPAVMKDARHWDSSCAGEADSERRWVPEQGGGSLGPRRKVVQAPLGHLPTGSEAAEPRLPPATSGFLHYS